MTENELAAYKVHIRLKAHIISPILGCVLDKIDGLKVRLTKLSRISGIYIYSLNRRALYVGKSTNLLVRINEHMNTEYYREHDRLYVIECVNDIETLERFLIGSLSPIFNKTYRLHPDTNEIIESNEVFFDYIEALI